MKPRTTLASSMPATSRTNGAHHLPAFWAGMNVAAAALAAGWMPWQAAGGAVMCHCVQVGLDDSREFVGGVAMSAVHFSVYLFAFNKCPC
jgi:hypothetical protein